MKNEQGTHTHTHRHRHTHKRFEKMNSMSWEEIWIYGLAFLLSIPSRPSAGQ